jgi:hypothetical protein
MYGAVGGGITDALRRQEFQHQFLQSAKKLEIAANATARFWERSPVRCIACRVTRKPRRPACIISKEHLMRNRLLANRIFAIAAVAAAIGVPMSAQAQGEITTGVVRGGTVIMNDEVEGITVDQRPAFREYVVRERVPNYSIPERVIVGGVLPETGVTYYDVPQTYGVMPYRYTVVNGQTVLVEPRSRRIVQVVE